MIKVLMYGDAVIQTGFARVLHNLADQLHAKGYEIIVAGLNWQGYPRHNYAYPIVGISTSNDAYGHKRLAELLDAEQPDILLMLNDLWVLADVLAYARNASKWSGRSIGYFPIDAIGYNKQLANLASKFDVPVTYTKFGEQVLRTAGYEGRLEILPHGVNTELFYPIAKAELRPEGMEQDFIVLCNNRNQPRKRLDILVQGFVQFLCQVAPEQRSKLKLFLHCHWRDIGWDLHKLCEAEFEQAGLNMADHILATANFDLHNVMPEKMLNQLYNFADVCINTGLGEGWGLCQSESACAGVANIVPEFAATGELFANGRGYLLKPAMYIRDGNNEYGVCLKRGLIAPETVASKLLEAWENAEQRQSIANAGMAYFRQPQFAWSEIANKLEGWLCM